MGIKCKEVGKFCEFLAKISVYHGNGIR